MTKRDAGDAAGDYPTDHLVKLGESIAFAIDAGVIQSPDSLTWHIPVKSNLTDRRWLGTFTLRPAPFVGRVPKPPAYLADDVDPPPS